jgi:hypothetical protein
MRVTGWNPRRGALAVAVLALAAISIPGAAAVGAAAANASGVPGPTLKLEAAQHSGVTVQSFQGFVQMDPGIWLASLGSALQFEVQRASYTRPVSIAQVIYPPYGGTVRRPLPAALLDGWNGLRDFLKMTVRNSAGKVVAAPMLTLCPNTYDPERASPDSPATPVYPQLCGQDPFPLSMVWGIAKGWATDPAEYYPNSPLGPGPFMRLPLGKYQVTETVTPAYMRLFHISAPGSTQTVAVTVVKGRGCCAAAPARQGHAGPAALPRVPYLPDPPKSALPDLVPLPSWGISTSHTRSGADLLNFGATVWIGGNGPLDVEGFRSNGSPVMKAYQYFWENGRVIGRARAGTMGFDSQKGHNHWHFEQFARYTLLNVNKSVAVASHKVGFCIGASDPVNLLAPHAVWQPPVIGLTGQCGSPTALWVRETLPVGWGDTYFQTVAGQSFDITHVPNGTYYIEVTANPQRVLYETSVRNDVSLRKVILGGGPGHRTVKVPAWHGIDPEP